MSVAAPTYRSDRSTGVMAIALVLVVVGASLFNILPLVTAGAANKLGFSARQVGLMASVLTFASGLSALSAGAWVRSLHWPRASAVSLGGMIAANVVTLFVRDYWAFVLLQGVASFFACAAFSLGMTILSDRHESARTFGIAISAQAIYQIAALWTGPSLLRFSGVNGVLAVLTIPAALAMVLTPFLPDQGRALPAGQSHRGLFRPATLLAFAGFLVFFVGAGAYWTYAELMGQSHGMTTRAVADWAAAAVAGGIPGGLIASAQGSRFGNLGPLVGAALLLLVAAAMLSGAYGVVAFGIGGVLYYSLWCYSLAYQLALVNVVDSTGRAVAVTGACAYFGSAAGAALAAPFVAPNDYHAVLWIVALAACGSAAMYALAAAVHRRTWR